MLAGRPGRERVVKDASGEVIDTIQSQSERDGSDVYLTLDHTIQANAQVVLKQTVARWRAKSATAIVLDPRTGAVLAMAVAPGFDANAFPQTWREFQRNRAVTDTYEPGSTFKVVTVAGVLSDHLVTPMTRFVLPYSIHVADRVIHDAEPRGTETMSVAQILSRSSNVGAITLAEKLQKHRLVQWIDRFGFGKRTGIDYPGESPGIALPEDRWSGSTIGNVPIGQGISVTPIQMASAYGAIANRGSLGAAASRRPHRRPALGRAHAAADHLAARRGAAARDAEERRARRDRHARGRPRLPGRGQDRHRGEGRPGRHLLDVSLRRVVHRHRARLAASARDSGIRRRAARRDLGRRRGGPGLLADRALRPAVPRRRHHSGRARDSRLDARRRTRSTPSKRAP